MLDRDDGRLLQTLPAATSTTRPGCGELVLKCEQPEDMERVILLGGGPPDAQRARAACGVMCDAPISGAQCSMLLGAAGSDCPAERVADVR
mmetsp:Transcript_130049/g.236222  ORF Transcript_130049/g.236222 Transcript_130049/m.236222 type:complete len:91 (+) Transcript_130049:420-692(+)